MEHKIPGNSPFNNQHYHHVGVIVKDMEKTIAYLSSLGIGPFGMPGGQKWVEVPFKGELRGKPAAWKVKISNAILGSGELELLQPSGGASLLQEFLDNHGEGLHHLGYVTDNLDRDVKTLAGQGVKVLTSAVTEKGGFAYFDTSVNGGVVTELRQLK
jgi:catechol 2,3-dioxygenase-like lactoylglutathione lyase family enzyme